jgi:hypothetical protein
MAMKLALTQFCMGYVRERQPEKWSQMTGGAQSLIVDISSRPFCAANVGWCDMLGAMVHFNVFAVNIMNDARVPVSLDSQTGAVQQGKKDIVIC